MGKRKTILKKDCHDIFVKFLAHRVGICKTNSFTFVARDVIDHMNYDEKRFNRYITQADCRSMGHYLHDIEDKDITIDGIRFYITLYRYKNRSQKIYKLEVIER